MKNPGKKEIALKYQEPLSTHTCNIMQIQTCSFMSMCGMSFHVKWLSQLLMPFHVLQEAAPTKKYTCAKFAIAVAP